MHVASAPSAGPSPQDQPREFLLSLYQAAVLRALPLHNMAAYLPKPLNFDELVRMGADVRVEPGADVAGEPVLTATSLMVTAAPAETTP